MTGQRFDLDTVTRRRSPRITRLLDALEADDQATEEPAPVTPWDPWKTLTAREDITLYYAWLPPGLQGTVDQTRDGWKITLEATLDRVTRRCVLAHELIHVEREIIVGPRLSMIREEAIVHSETARRLVPPSMLETLIDQRRSLGKGVDARLIAKEFDVAKDVAREAGRVLRRIRRGVPLPAFAEAWEATR